MSNYPDDIRQYDNDPRSPFYVEPPVECSTCTNHFEGDTAYEPSEDYKTEFHLKQVKHKNFCSKDCHDEYFLCSDCEKVECDCDEE